MKVCIVGSAPSSVKLQPYQDPSWKIWACSPGSTAHLQRVDSFFELHRWEPTQPWFDINYRMYLANLKCPVYMVDPITEIPSSVAYPKNEMIEKFGAFFWTSTISWMMALAIHQGAKEITFAGIDMSAQEEWNFQRSGAHFFIHTARELGIKVTAPPESDLLRPPPMYGFREVDPMHIKMLVRENEMRANVQAAEVKLQQARDELMFFKGALDDCVYTIKTWVSDPHQLEVAYRNPAKDEPRPILGEEFGVEIVKVDPEEIKPPMKAKPKARKPRGRPRKNTNGAAHAS